MSISTVANTVVDTVKNAAVTVAGGVKTGVVWLGRTISTVFTDYIIPGIKAVWNNLLPLLQTIGSYIKTGASKTVQFLRTGYGLGGSLAAVGVGLFLQGYEHDDKKTQFAQQAVAVALIAAGVGVIVAFKAAVVV